MMSIWHDWRKAGVRRRLEAAAMLIFTQVGGATVLASGLRSGQPIVLTQESQQVTAQASAMPDQAPQANRVAGFFPFPGDAQFQVRAGD